MRLDQLHRQSWKLVRIDERLEPVVGVEHGVLEERQEDLEQLATLCEERRQMADQERIHFWLHSWLLLHIPLSVALLVLGVVHAVTTLSSGTIP